MDPDSISTAMLGDAPHSASILALALEADIVVKLVMIILVLASLWVWAVVFDKTVRLIRLKRQSTVFERAFWAGTPLAELYRKLGNRIDHPMALMFAAGMEEWRESPKALTGEATERLLARIGQVMQLTMEREMRALERHVGTLATIGSAAPFVGLLGTVWGIMNSFQSIAMTKNTTLAVVAPGIAEALFATALGLFAAIPAVIAYNKIATSVDGLGDRLGSFADEFCVVVSREIDSQRAAA
jgi:biopolymer transport protein TolQ